MCSREVQGLHLRRAVAVTVAIVVGAQFILVAPAVVKRLRASTAQRSTGVNAPPIADS